MIYHDDHEKLVSLETSRADMFMLANRYMSLYKVFRDYFIRKYKIYFMLFNNAVNQNRITDAIYAYEYIKGFLDFSIYVGINYSILLDAVDRKFSKLVNYIDGRNYYVCTSHKKRYEKYL